MPSGWHEWLRLFARTAVGSLVGCAIAYIASTAPCWSGEPHPQTHDSDEVEIQFLRRVLADTEDAWLDIFRKAGRRYQEPTLVLFSRITHSACGLAKAVTGPFYCTLDQKIYLDLSFFNELKREYHAPGNFAQAYVIAHEIGHHVQKLLGVEDKISSLQARMNERGANRLSVALELQADCLAGVWASSLRRRPGVVLMPEDIDEALRATRALGDDTIQRLETGTVILDSFTHGAGDQRARWFKRGLDTGEVEQCNTFGASDL